MTGMRMTTSIALLSGTLITAVRTFGTAGAVANAAAELEQRAAAMSAVDAAVARIAPMPVRNDRAA